GWFRDFVDRSDLPHIHLHSLRHTNATIQIANGSSVTTVAGYLGHANASTTTKIYAHSIQEAQAATAEMLDDVFSVSKAKRHA
ncbi:MAG: tyrosine-type recombinase/integrase, partial [Oscillospiraceae bacterium]|nr:tyrosine-type recombinase/integrase [Oscillospiraceae bacterium]